MIQLTNKGHWAVQVPDDAYNFQMADFGFENWNTLYYTVGESNNLNDPNCKRTISKSLHGNWKIICTSKEATEEQAAQIVDWKDFQGYKDYSSPNERFYFTQSKDSLDSLLTSKGCDSKLNWLFLENLGT